MSLTERCISLGNSAEEVFAPNLALAHGGRALEQNFNYYSTL
jgi:hypothetical protein